jgi:hypothetical protein
VTVLCSGRKNDFSIFLNSTGVMATLRSKIKNDFGKCNYWKKWI